MIDSSGVCCSSRAAQIEGGGWSGSSDTRRALGYAALLLGELRHDLDLAEVSQDELLGRIEDVMDALKWADSSATGAT